MMLELEKQKLKEESSNLNPGLLSVDDIKDIFHKLGRFTIIDELKFISN
jgi:hypothetical protein